MGSSLFDPVIQTIIVGIVIQSGACAAFLYLYATHRSHRYLLLWGISAFFYALRWCFHYAGESNSAVLVLEALLAAVALSMTWLGAYELVPRRPWRTRTVAAVLALFFAVLIVVAAHAGRIIQIFYGVAVVMILGLEVCLWQGWRATRLSGFLVVGVAYLVQAGVLLLLQALWGEQVRNLVIGPLLNLFTVGGFILIGFQLTDRQRGAAERTLRHFFDTAPVPIIICRVPGGQIEQVNQAGIDMAGVPLKALLGKTAAEIGIVIDPAARHAMAAALRAGRASAGHELSYIRRGRRAAQHRTQFAVNASPLQLEDGVRHIFVLHDITELRRAQGELAALNASLERQVAERTRDLEMFGYSLSHDLRGPLRAINGFAALLLDNPTLDDDARQLAQRVRHNGQRMNQLVDAVLGYSRDSTKKITLAPCALDPLMEAFIGEYRLQYSAAQVRVEPLGRVVGDATMLQQTLENLVSNALKYSARRQGARVDIWREERGNQAVIHVRDNGCGFDMAHAGQLFKLFQRIHSADEYDGIGVGLAVVKRFVERMEGSIEVESAVDQGTTFRVTLPAAG